MKPTPPVPPGTASLKLSSAFAFAVAQPGRFPADPMRKEPVGSAECTFYLV